jgi:hypothetical protein
MTRRAGVTLVEVLVAIFITGIGLMSLLVLFPLGALNMAQAIKDQRAADASRIADSLARAWDLRYDTNVFAAYQQPSAILTGSPSYIAYIDPQGCRITGSGPMSGVTGINRVCPAGTIPTGNNITTGLTLASNTQQIAQWTTLQDELVFDPSGAPLTFGTAPSVFVERNPRYSWAWMCQQIKASSTNTVTTPVNLTVVVYDRRPLVPSASGLQEEVVCTGNFSAGSNMARLSWSSASPPQLKRGTWIMDAMTTHGYWYRVVGVTPVTPNSADVELHINARAGGTGTTLVVDSVVEVFDKGQ